MKGLDLPENCAVRLIDLDPRVNALSAVDEEGFVNIYVNARLDEAGRYAALRHELRHCLRGDFTSSEDIRAIEDAAREADLPARDNTPPPQRRNEPRRRLREAFASSEDIRAAEDAAREVELSAHDGTPLPQPRNEPRRRLRQAFASSEDIRAIEDAAREAELLACDGTPLPEPPVFRREGLRAIGRGLYRPAGENMIRVMADIRALGAAAEAACDVFDVLQTPPLLSVHRLRDCLSALGPGDIAFLIFQPEAARAAFPAALHLYRQAADTLQGALFYDSQGRADNALLTCDFKSAPALRLTLDIRRHHGAFEVARIYREIDGKSEIIY